MPEPMTTAASSDEPSNSASSLRVIAGRLRELTQLIVPRGTPLARLGSDKLPRMFTAFNVALFGHIVGVLLLFSGIALAGVPFEAARRRTDPGEIAIMLGIARKGVPIAGAGILLLLACGFWLVHLGRWSLGTGWVAAALVLFVVAGVLGAVA